MEPIQTGTVSPVSTISSPAATTGSTPSLVSTITSSPVSFTGDLDSAALHPYQDASTLKRKSPSDEDEDSASSPHPPKRRSSEWMSYAAQFQEFTPEIPHGTTPWKPFTAAQDATIVFPVFQADAYPMELDDIIMSDNEALPQRKTLEHHEYLLATTKARIETIREMPKKNQHGRLEAAWDKKAWLEAQIANPPPPPAMIRWRYEKLEDEKSLKLREKSPAYSTASDGLIRKKLPANICSIFFNFLQGSKAERTCSNETAHRDLSILLTKLLAFRKALGKKYTPRNVAQPTLPELDTLLADIQTRMADVKACMSSPSPSTATHTIEALHAAGIDNGHTLILKFTSKFCLDRATAALCCNMLTPHEQEQFRVPYAPHNRGSRTCSSASPRHPRAGAQGREDAKGPTRTRTEDAGSEGRSGQRTGRRGVAVGVLGGRFEDCGCGSRDASD